MVVKNAPYYLSRIYSFCKHYWKEDSDESSLHLCEANHAFAPCSSLDLNLNSSALSKSI